MDKLDGVCLCSTVGNYSLNFDDLFDELYNYNFTGDDYDHSDADEDVDWPTVLYGTTFAVSVSTILLNTLSMLAMRCSRGTMSANLRIIFSLTLSQPLTLYLRPSSVQINPPVRTPTPCIYTDSVREQFVGQRRGRGL